MDIKIDNIKDFSEEKPKIKERDPEKKNFLNREISFSKGGLSSKLKEEIYNDMGMLLEAGVDIKSALSLIVNEQKSDKNRSKWKKVLQSLENGESTAVSFRNGWKISEYEYTWLKIGEETGNLPSILINLSSFFGKRVKQTRQIVNTLTYPLFVIFTAILVVSFMMGTIIPMFSDVFTRVSGELPALTQAVLSVSNWFRDNILIILGLIVVIVATLIMIRKNIHYRRISAMLLMKMPILGEIFMKSYSTQFLYALAMMIKSRIPLVEALEHMKKMITFYPIETAIVRIKEALINGKSLNMAMKDENIFSEKIVFLTGVGEEINQLDTIYLKIVAQLEEEINHKTRLLNSIIEPILIVFIGIFVAIILIAMYLPMFSISNSMF